MKIENKDVTIKIGNKQKSFKNLILDSYIELFRDSFLEFKNKTLECCFVKFNSAQELNEKSTDMDYDIMLNTSYNKIQENFIDSTIINKYTYETEYRNISEHTGEKICGIGFGKFDWESNKPLLYAFLDVSKYNIVIQENQNLVISRIDKITTDLLFFSPFGNIKAPYHLTIAGLLNVVGMEYTSVIPKLSSIGFGNLYNVIRDEVHVEELNIQNEGIDTINIGLLTLTNEGEGVYPSLDLYPSPDLYLGKATPRWIIYKFKLYEEKIVDFDTGQTELIDTGLYYYQSQYIESFGNFNLKIKYERG